MNVCVKAVSFVSVCCKLLQKQIKKNTFHNGCMHNVQHSQAMLKRGVCRLARLFFSLFFEAMFLKYQINVVEKRIFVIIFFIDTGCFSFKKASAVRNHGFSKNNQ